MWIWHAAQQSAGHTLGVHVNHTNQISTSCWHRVAWLGQMIEYLQGQANNLHSSYRLNSTSAQYGSSNVVKLHFAPSVSHLLGGLSPTSRHLCYTTDEVPFGSMSSQTRVSCDSAIREHLSRRQCDPHWRPLAVPTNHSDTRGSPSATPRSNNCLRTFAFAKPCFRAVRCIFPTFMHTLYPFGRTLHLIRPLGYTTYLTKYVHDGGGI